MHDDGGDARDGGSANASQFQSSVGATGSQLEALMGTILWWL
jgi:hypothetical protein